LYCANDIKQEYTLAFVFVGDILPSIMGAIVSAIAFPYPPKHYSEDALRSRQDLKFLKTKTGIQIPCVHITKCGAKFTIIYSHGNAEDVGLSLNYLDVISDTLDASVIAYEYQDILYRGAAPLKKIVTRQLMPHINMQQRRLELIRLNSFFMVDRLARDRQ